MVATTPRKKSAKKNTPLDSSTPPQFVLDAELRKLTLQTEAIVDMTVGVMLMVTGTDVVCISVQDIADFNIKHKVVKTQVDDNTFTYTLEGISK